MGKTTLFKAPNSGGASSQVLTLKTLTPALSQGSVKKETKIIAIEVLSTLQALARKFVLLHNTSEEVSIRAEMEVLKEKLSVLEDARASLGAEMWAIAKASEMPKETICFPVEGGIVTFRAGGHFADHSPVFIPYTTLEVMKKFSSQTEEGKPSNDDEISLG